MQTWRYELTYPGIDSIWEEGFESEDDAQQAMDERMTELIDEIAEKNPEKTDKEIESMIEWDLRPC